MTNSIGFSFCLSFILTCNVFLVDISQAQCDFTPAVAASNTGEWGEEMSWELYGPEPNSENLVASFQGVDDYTNSLDTLCLEPGCYAFVMYDSWGHCVSFIPKTLTACLPFLLLSASESAGPGFFI